MVVVVVVVVCVCVCVGGGGVPNYHYAGTCPCVVKEVEAKSVMNKLGGGKGFYLSLKLCWNNQLLPACAVWFVWSVWSDS